MNNENFDKQIKKLNFIIESLNQENIFLKGQIDALLCEKNLLEKKNQNLESSLYFKLKKLGGKILRKFGLRK